MCNLFVGTWNYRQHLAPQKKKTTHAISQCSDAVLDENIKLKIGAGYNTAVENQHVFGIISISIK